MATTDLRDIDISHLSFTQLQELSAQIDERVTAIRAKFIEEAAQLGLACDARAHGKRKPRRNSHRQQHEQ